MTDGDEDATTHAPSRALHGERSNAYLSWAAIVAVVLLGVRGFAAGLAHDVLFAATVTVVALVPAIALDSRRAALPWEVTILAVIPLLVATVAPTLFARQIVLYAGAAAIALALTLEVHALTEVRLERSLALSFVTMVSAALGATWATITWTLDGLAGTAVIASNAQAMWLLIAATASGLFAGVAFDQYYRQFPGEELVSSPVDGLDENVFARKTDVDDYPTLEERLPLSAGSQRGLVWTMRIGLAAILAYGVISLDGGLVSNAGAMLAVTFLPAILRRRYDLPFDAGLVLWVTVAVFLHAVGSAYLYDRTFWWHNLTHPLSATLVGGLGSSQMTKAQTLDGVDLRRRTAHSATAQCPCPRRPSSAYAG